ncbi:MAG: alpha-hydroxy-acid oxidizing enzyme [Chloroflexi bacterium]|nr:MAG: alpha-hydroxy-acid oxidizing enzyme [Chloroflexota bacterium]
MQPINVHEYEELARAQLHPAVWDYFSAGANDEVTLRENRVAFERLQLRPRMLVDVSRISMATTLLGTPVAMPIGVAPTAVQGAGCAEGECATARAAGALGALMVASTESTRPLEEIAQAAAGPLWFQLYFSSRAHESALRLVRRAEAAGYRAIVPTVDAPRAGRKERHIRSRETFEWPPSGNFLLEPSGDDEDLDGGLTWEDIKWLREITSLPIVVKGILTAEDAILGVECGVAGLLVSNHGGRQLDTVAATIEALPEVVEAVAGRCEVYLDGGVRRGTDVMKALALGARAVFVGRPVLWGLAVAGADGAQHVLELLRDELELAMALSGRPTLASIDAALVQRSGAAGILAATPGDGSPADAHPGH